MTWKPEHLLAASVDELLAFVSQGVPTLRQMHAIRELAVRAQDRPELLRLAVDAITSHLGHRWRMGGLPVGYLGAKVLFEGNDTGRQALWTGLAVAPPLEAEDVLRWLSPPAAAPLPAVQLGLVRELMLDDTRSEDDVRSAVAAVVGDTPSVDVLALAGHPGAVALVELSVDGWTRLEREGERLSAALGTTVYWPPPDALGPLGPDLRVAVGPDGRRELVNLVPADGGYRREAWAGAVPDA